MEEKPLQTTDIKKDVQQPENTSIAPQVKQPAGRLQAACFAPAHSLVQQVPRALVVSVIAAGMDVVLLVLLVEILHMPKILAATISYLLGGIVQYVLCSWWVFSVAMENVATGFITFSILSLVGLGITDLVMWGMYGRLHYHYLLAKVAALGLAFCWNFTSRKYLIFRQQAKPEID